MLSSYFLLIAFGIDKHFPNVATNRKIKEITAAAFNITKWDIFL